MLGTELEHSPGDGKGANGASTGEGVLETWIVPQGPE